MLYAEIIGLV